MRLPLIRQLTFRWGLLVLLGAATRSAQAQRAAQVEPLRPFQMRITDKYFQTDMEFERGLEDVGVPATSVSHQRLLIQPVLGLGLAGSVYHPNLLQYQLKTELGLDWQDSRMTPGGEAADTQFLQRYHGSVDFLQQKPYATTLFADKDLIFRDYDFFSRVRVENQRYGARTGFSDGPVPFSVSAQHYDEVIVDPTRPTRLNEDTLAVNAQSLRRSDQARTHLNYNLDQFSRMETGYGDQRGLNQNVNLVDNESFGAGDWANLSSLLNYNAVSEILVPTDRVLFQEDLRLAHTPRLRSFYEYAFDAASSGDADSKTHQGRVGLSFNLIENLTSTFDLHGLTGTSSSPGDTSTTSRYGVAHDEQYSKPLGNWGSLALGYNGRIDREERTASGQTIAVIDEKHSLADGTITFLNQPLVNGFTIHVTDLTRMIIYFEGVDYRVTPRGALTQIERLPGGRIPNPGTVAVDYSAAVPASAGDDAWDNTINFRLELWHGLLGLYGRWSILDYSGADQLLLRTLDDKTIGVDSTWHWLRTGAEYEVADSNLAPYDRVRLYQSAQFQAAENTTLGVDLDQNWTHFRDTGLRQDTYGLVARYQQRLTENLGWNVESGIRIDRGFTFNREVSVARVGLDWTYGKLSVKFGYEYNNESQPASLAERHFVHLRVRRTF